MEERLTDKFLLELRDRMSDMMAAMQLLMPLIRDKGDKKDKEYLATINKSFYSLLRSVRHMQVCTSEPDFHPRTIDLAGLCRTVGGQCESVAKTLNITFEWSIAQSSVLSVGDDGLLEMALLNLLANAFTAAGPGGKVTLRGRQIKNQWVATVLDSGPGLRQTKTGEDPFLKTPGGAGLGLEVAWAVAELHRGRVMLVNGGKRGVRARLLLPIQKPEQGELVHDPLVKIDRSGGFSTTMVEFSPLLPVEEFSIPNSLD